MKKLLVLTVFQFLFANGFSQPREVIIEGRILGYKGHEGVAYSLNDYFGGGMNTRVFPDSLGRFVIREAFPRTAFFSMTYIQDNTWHSCRLILEPGSHYSFISKGMNHDDWKTHYSPDIYQVPIRKNDFNSYYKTDLGQQYFNLIDNGTSGSLYHEDWNLLQPDSLLLILDRRIKNQLSYFDGLFKAGEINKTFYDIARLNIEYTNAYRLVATIYYSWPQGKFKTSDTTIYPRLKKIYSEVFRRYPVNKELKIETHYCFDRYVDLYLLYIADSETGEYIPGSRKGKASEIQLTYSENYLNNKANDFYRMLKTLTYMFDYGSNSLKVGKEYLSKPHLESKFADRYIEEFLIPRAKEYEDQYNRPLPSGIVILDEKDTLETFEQLLSLVGGGQVFIDLWGTWCLPCRYQFQYIDSLKPFFHDNGIKKIYIAVEYQTGREEWKNFLKLYNPEGYHMMANSRFKADFERHAGKISKFPTFMIIDKNGEIVERNAFFPSDAKLLVDQLKEKLKLVP